MNSDYNTLDIVDLISEVHKELRQEVQKRWHEISNEEINNSETYILALADKGEFTMAEMARKMGISRQGVHKLVKGLMLKEYVELNMIQGNKKEKIITLTNKGEQCNKEMKRIKREIEREIEFNIGSKEKDFLRSILCKELIK